MRKKRSKESRARIRSTLVRVRGGTEQLIRLGGLYGVKNVRRSLAHASRRTPRQAGCAHGTMQNLAFMDSSILRTRGEKVNFSSRPARLLSPSPRSGSSLGERGEGEKGVSISSCTSLVIYPALQVMKSKAGCKGRGDLNR